VNTEESRTTNAEEGTIRTRTISSDRIVLLSAFVVRLFSTFSRLRVVAALAVLLTASPVSAGLHYSGETVTELPSRWRGFLIDHRSLRGIAVARTDGLPPSPLRDEYLAALAKLEPAAKTADELADVGALHVRLGKPEKAIAVLRPAARRFPEHFRIAANLGTAWQLAGDPERAADALGEAVRLAPPRWKPFEEAHLKLVRLRLKNPKADGLDDLFGAKYSDEAAAVAQQLALWLPADGRLLWQLGEIAHAFGDTPTAAAILDGCVTEFNMANPALRKRRLELRSAADEVLKGQKHDAHRGTLAVRSPRPLARPLDESKLPAVRADGPNPLPWAVLGATAPDVKGRLAFPKYLDKLDGKTVVVTGFMQPLRDELELTGFLLLEYPVGCWFCETPEATGLVEVRLRPGVRSELKKGLVKVTGTFALNRTDPESYPFSLADARVGEAD
jgi:hypothetical protein